VLTTVGRLNSSREKLKTLRSELTSGCDPSDCPIYFERTLDEAYYPGLTREALDKRNQDQIVSYSGDNFGLHMKEGGKGDANTPILMVSQLWFWKIGKSVISAHCKTEEVQLLRHIPYVSLSHQIEPDVLAGLLMARCINSFGEIHSHEGFDCPPTFDLFENRVVGILSEVGDYVGAGKSSEVEFAKEQYFTHVVSDVRSELAMIQHFLEEQETILGALIEDHTKSISKKDASHQAPPSSTPYDNGRPPLAPEDMQSSCSRKNIPTSAVLDKRLDEEASLLWAEVAGAQETLQKYMKRVRKIDGDAERVEKAIQDLLNLKRTHASIQDAHSSLILSTAVIGFTVVTIVFAPLAFLTALFALKVKGFRQLQVVGQDDVFDGGKLSGIFGEHHLETAQYRNKTDQWQSVLRS